MQTLRDDLCGVVEKHLRAADRQKVLTILSALCAEEAPVEVQFPLITDKPSRFEVNGDTVLDRRTGLTWSRKPIEGGCRNWTDAKKAATACTLGGHTDWRLPHPAEHDTAVVVELMMSRHSPAPDIRFDLYWSSDPAVLLPFNYHPSRGKSVERVYPARPTDRAYVRAIRFPGVSRNR